MNNPIRLGPRHLASSFGRVEFARYQESLIEEYQNNPLIEALEPILSKEEVIDKLGAYPGLPTPKDRELPEHILIHKIKAVERIFVPHSRVIDLERKISVMLRTGYEPRDPLARGYWRKLAAKLDVLGDLMKAPTSEELNGQLYMLCEQRETGNRILMPLTSAKGFSFSGMSGMGKTLSMRKVFNLYPQVLIHDQYYKGKPVLGSISALQVVYLMVACPADATLKQFLIFVCKAVDDLLGTDYFVKIAKRGDASKSSMMMGIANVFSQINLGALAIDNIESLRLGKGSDSAELLKYLVALVELFNIPIILIGTLEAEKVLTGNFSISRRGAGQGDDKWLAFAKENNDWNLLIDTLGKYQYTKSSADLIGESLDDVIFDMSQGIIDVAVKVFALAQKRAIITGHTKLTKNIFETVFDDSLQGIRNAIIGLRKNDPRRLLKYEDLVSLVRQMYEKEMDESSQPTEVVTALAASTEGNSNDAAVSATEHPKASHSGQGRPRGNLVKLCENAEKKQMHPYQALKDAGYVRDPAEFLLPS